MQFFWQFPILECVTIRWSINGAVMCQRLVLSNCQSSGAVQLHLQSYMGQLPSEFMRSSSSWLLKHVKYLVNSRNCEENSTFCQHIASTFTLPFSPLLTTFETLLKCRHAAVIICSICVGHVWLVVETLLEKLQAQVLVMKDKSILYVCITQC